MKNLVIILSFLVPAAAATAQSNPVFLAITASQQARFDAMTAKDTLALRELLTDDLLYVHSNALVENKSQFLQDIASGKLIYEKITPQPAKVRLYGKIGIADGKINVKGQLNGAPFEIVLIYTAVYRKVKGKWLLTSWQSTRVP